MMTIILQRSSKVIYFVVFEVTFFLLLMKTINASISSIFLFESTGCVKGNRWHFV